MGRIVKFKKRGVYLVLAVILLTVEFLIERNLNSGFIRFYVGDYLAAVLIYTFVMFVFKPYYFSGAMAVLFFCYVIEVCQWVDVLSILRIGKSRMTDVLVGNTFSWLDVLCYTLGIATVFMVEFQFDKGISYEK
ncbi:ribosomal maturation YjgA family protein [Wenyingzhuangia sp. IMCC45574]